MSRALSEKMKRLWADPVWAKRQRQRISNGLLASPHVAPAAKARCEREREKREHQKLGPAYDPIRDNPRMRKLLGSL